MPDFEVRDDERPFHMGRYFAHIVGWSFMLSFAIIAMAVAVAATHHLLAGRAEEHDHLAAVGGLVAAAALCWPLWKYRPDFTMGEPRTARGNRMRLILLGLVGLGIAVALPLISQRGTDGGTLDLFSNSPLPTRVVVPMLAMWTIGIPIFSVLSRRNSDDFARAAHDFGFMMGGQVFYFAAPVWWLAWRGGLLPRPDVMVLFLASLVTVSFATLWKRQHG